MYLPLVDYIESVKASNNAGTKDIKIRDLLDYYARYNATVNPGPGTFYAGKKQAFLANELGYHPKTFSMLLNGRKPIRIDDIVIFCRYFKEPPSTFIRIDQAS